MAYKKTPTNIDEFRWLALLDEVGTHINEESVCSVNRL